MAHIVNLDRIPRPNAVTFISPVDGLERGLFLEIVGMAKNDIWLDAVDDDFEAYEVQLANASTKKENLIMNTTVPRQYDERLTERDFVMAKGAIGRGHYLERGDEITLPVDFVSGVSAVGDEVELAEGGKLAKLASGEAVGEVVRIYTWNDQESVMIRFY